MWNQCNNLQFYDYLTKVLVLYLLRNELFVCKYKKYNSFFIGQIDA